ncbi:MAG: hypothetical protein COX29_00600 [Candidatus Moranbacteria bacterium CG23_combo_of_CG06-09_8_20_14_all_35_22]|nr:MAG: hypothetical protein COX29_00600 [Candidatus Moranbacteria bacterium CG23_combo_of_CG06-09_8_20_14_all_35_22]
MENLQEKLAYEWITAEAGNVDVASDFYCATRDIFEARNDKMPDYLIEKGMDDGLAYMIYSMAGELGNNSFDHNLGNWPDIPGIFYAYNYDGEKGFLMMADRGIGVWNSLKKAVPDLKSDCEALELAFTKKISSRILENRGNGLKFVKNNIFDKNLFMEFRTGNAKVSLNHEMKIIETDEDIKGCLIILKF